MYKPLIHSHLNIHILFAVFVAGISLSFFPSPCTAGVWQVIPIRLDLDQKSRSGVITVRNDSEERLTIHAEALEWLQDETGKDIYQPTKDLIFFPKILTINPKEERVVRAGIRIPEVNREKTFRLFLKEIPEEISEKSNAVIIAIKFGAPVFSKPVVEEISGEIANIDLQKSQLNLRIHNTGNTHFRISTIEVAGHNENNPNLFFTEINGWYLLSGAERTYSAPIPEDICHKLKALDIKINTDRIDLNGQIDVDPSMCEIQ